MRGRTVRLQFNAKCSTTTTLRYAIVEWTGTADAVTSDVVNTWTSTTYTASNFFIASTTATTGTTSVGTSYTACSLSAAVSASANNLIVFVWTDGTAAQNVTVEISDVILCDANLPRDWLPDPVGVERQRCYRFYRKTFPDGTAPAQNSATAGRSQYTSPVAGVALITLLWWQFGTPMRAAPSVTAYNPGAANAQARNESVSADCTSTGVDSQSVDSCRIFTQLPAATAVGHTITLHLSADAEL
jgi:hypothetical protein